MDTIEATTTKRLDLNPLSKEDFVEAVARTRSIETGETVLPSDIKDLSRVNERQLFVSLVYSGLRQVNSPVSDLFLEKLPQVLSNLADKSDGKALLIRGTRRVLRQLIKAGELSRKTAREIRRYALGHSQLDSDRTRLSEKRLNDLPDDTPLRTIKTAFERHSVNPAAIKEEHTAFKAHLRDEINS